MADSVHGNGQVGPTKMEIISALAQKELKFKAMLAAYFTDVSQFATKGAKSISFPKLSSFTVGLRPSGTQGDATVITSTVDKMELDIPAYLAWIIDPNDAIQSTLAWETETAKRAGGAHGRFFDEKIIARIAAEANSLGHVGDIDRDVILEMRQYIKKNEGDLNQTVLCVAADQETAMLKVDAFTRADVYGTSNVPGGVIGRVYGMPVLVHNGLADGEFFVGEKTGLAYGFQLGPNTSEQGANEYGSQAIRVAMDQLFGVKALQIDGTPATPAGKSSLLVKK